MPMLPDDVKKAVRNNGGGVANHDFFWQIMKKGTKEEGIVVEAIKKKWGSMDKFKEEFTNAAATLFGSGWAWLVVGNHWCSSAISMCISNRYARNWAAGAI